MLAAGGRVATFSTLADATKANNHLGSKYIVVLSLAEYKFYGLLLDHKSVAVVSKSMCLSEMILNNTGRPCIDFDSDVRDIIPDIHKFMYEYYLSTYGIHVTISWRWSDAPTRSWHCVVSGVYYKKCWREGCLRMVERMELSLEVQKIDKGIYRNNSSLRMIGQCKYVNNRLCKRLRPLHDCDVEDTYVTPTTGDIAMVEESDSPVDVPLRIPIDTFTDFKVPVGLVIGGLLYDNPTNKIYRLTRIHPSLCTLCNRIHQKENAIIIVRDSSIEFRCFRTDAVSVFRR